MLLNISVKMFSQEILISEKNIGANIGVNLAFGTHFQRLGFNLNFFYVNEFFQTNSELRLYLNIKNLGPKKIYPELLLAQGVVFGYGGKQNSFNSFINSVSNQTGYLSSIAYSYNAWFNKIKTVQQTGIVAFQFDPVTFIIENDILARGYYDRFRTGGFLLQYQHEDQFQAALSCAMWTGQMGRKVRGDKDYKAICYMDTTGGIYTNCSHGILSAQFKYNVGYAQNVQANIGIDAEQVRNAVQNKLIHDFIFIPRKWITPKNCHIPMINSGGGQFLYKAQQTIRKPKLFINVFSNASLFY